MRRDGSRRENGGRDSGVETIFVKLSDIHLSEKNRARLARDRGQIEQMRRAYENDEPGVPLKLIGRVDGTYDIDDGRHRFLAAELAGLTVIEAVVIGVSGKLSENHGSRRSFFFFFAAPQST